MKSRVFQVTNADTFAMPAAQRIKASPLESFSKNGLSWLVDGSLAISG